jgi:hypothetical protein
MAATDSSRSRLERQQRPRRLVAGPTGFYGVMPMCRSLVALILIATVAATPRAATVYRCSGDADEVYFTDRQCPGGEPQSVDPATVITVPGLDAQDRARVKQLDRDQAARVRALTAQRAAEFKAQARYEATRVRSCDAARAGLERVRQIRRRGYAASSAADLHARERKYALQADRNCD